MNDLTSNGTLSAAEHASAMVEYIADGTRRAYALGNRGPIRMGADGKLHRDILDAYWKLGEVRERRLRNPVGAIEAYSKVPTTSPKYRDAQKKVQELSRR